LGLEIDLIGTFRQKEFEGEYVILPKSELTDRCKDRCFSHLFFKNYDDAMTISSSQSPPILPVSALRRLHHIALNVGNMSASRHFYGTILGLHELIGTEIPSSLLELVQQGRVANFRIPDGTILDLFAEPDLSPPSPDPTQQFTRANHLAFDIAPDLFDLAVQVLRDHGVKIDGEPVTRSTGRGIYFYDPDGFMIEIRCDPDLTLGRE
jgi:glyoxylase I family protein